MFLTADQIDAISLQAEQFAEPVTDFLIADLAKRIAEAGQLTSTASYQVWKLQQLGVSQRQMKEQLKKLLKVTSGQLEQLLTQAAKVGYDFDIKRFPSVEAVPFEENESLQQVVSAAVKLADEDFNNITQTIGFVTHDGVWSPLTEAYRKSCDYAFQKVSTGAQDYNSAVREATRNLASKGIQVITYGDETDSKKQRRVSMEAAVRRCVMGGLGLMQEQISQQNHDDLGCDGWEISAHAGSAPDHEPIQGKQYSDEEYEKLNNSLVRRIGTLNCGHAAFPIILGVNSPQYTKAELEKMRRDNEKGITYNGRHYTLYKAKQKQRQLERDIRKQKRKILIDEKAGDKEKLQTDQIRYQVLNGEYKRFSDAAGLRMQHERMEMAGFGPKQAKAAEKAANEVHTGWLKSIGAENTGLNTLAKFEDAKYNNSEEYQLLTGYDRAVTKGDISPLAGFDLYKSTSAEIHASIIGQTTSTGVEIKSFSTHFIDRVIGQTSTPNAGMRQGVSISDALDALKNPVKLGGVRELESGDIRQTFVGGKAKVTISIRDQRLIQTNPRSAD